MRNTNQLVKDSSLKCDSIDYAVKLLLEKEQYEAMLAIETDLLEHYSKCFEVTLSYATMYAINNNLNRSVEIYEEWLHRNPDNAYAWHKLGQLLNLYNGDQNVVLNCYKHAVELEPGNATWHLGLGNAYAANSNLDSAISEYNTVSQIEPDALEAKVNTGFAYIEFSQEEKAAQTIHLIKEILNNKPSGKTEWMDTLNDLENKFITRFRS